MKWTLTSLCLLICGVPSVSADRPDLSRVAVLIGEDGFGHGCPVSEYVLLTAKHVAYGHQEVHGGPRTGSTYGVEVDGAHGIASAVMYSQGFDMALMKTTVKIREPYRIASSVKEGDRVWLIQYSREKKKAFRPEVVEAKVVTILPDHLILDDFGMPGASGGCVVNGDGEVVGIYVAYIPLGESIKDVVGLVVSVTPGEMEIMLAGVDR